MDRRTKAEHGSEKKRKLPEWFSLVLLFVGVLVMILVVRIFVSDIRVVDGPSMEPTLHDGERILVQKFGLSNVDRYDIVLWDVSENETLIKRVIGLPGDTVEITEKGTVSVNGEQLPPAYQQAAGTYQMEPVSVTLAEDEYYVLGDNRTNSKDSRELGPMPAEALSGVYLCTLPELHPMILLYGAGL